MKSLYHKILKIELLYQFYIRFLLPILRKQPFPSTILGCVKGRHPSYSLWLEKRRGLDLQKYSDLSRDPAILRIQPAEVFQEQNPVFAIPGLPETFISSSTHNCPEVFLAHIPWGRVATHNMEVVAPDDRVFDDFFFPPPDEIDPARSLIMPMLPRCKIQRGVYAIFANHRARNYFHWVINSLTRLWILESAGIREYKLLVPKETMPFHIPTLELLGFPRDRLQPFGEEHWCIEHLLVPSFPMAFWHVSRPGCHWVREKMLAGACEPVKSPLKRIYISRALATQRRLVNEMDIENLLKRFGFVTVKPETLPVEGQINLFRQAEVVVAPHGAGLTNILFMPPTSLVIELVPSQKPKPYYCHLASAMDLGYACVTDAPVEPHSTTPSPSPTGDFAISVERLAQAIHNLGL